MNKRIVIQVVKAMFTLYGIAVAPALKPYKKGLLFTHITGAPNDNFWKISVR